METEGCTQSVRYKKSSANKKGGVADSREGPRAGDVLRVDREK